MKDVYNKILEKALPFYEAGREGDVVHVKWLFDIIPKYVLESEIDYDILMPVVILHDVGYSKVPKGSNPYNLDIRKLHSEEGAKIAESVLSDLDYPADKIKEVSRLILKHDNWAFGDSFSDEPILSVFTNFDFMWMASKKGFSIVRKFTDQNPRDFYEQIEKFREINEKEGRKWFNSRIKECYENLMRERLAEL